MARTEALLVDVFTVDCLFAAIVGKEAGAFQSKQKWFITTDADKSFLGLGREHIELPKRYINLGNGNDETENLARSGHINKTWPWNHVFIFG